ncbi:MAG: ABC transporter permease [Dysgonamonadaceae bacterium]
MRTLPFLLKKEFLQLRRNKMLLRMLVFLPLFQLGVLPWAATLDVRDFTISIVDNDNSSFSRNLIQKIKSTGFFRLADFSRSNEEALKSIEKGKSQAIINIPANLEKDIINGHTPQIMLSIDAVNGSEAGIALSYISQIITNFAKEINPNPTSTGNIQVVSSYRFNPHMNYRTYMVPGIIVLLVSILGGMLSSLNIVSEKELGTIEQINVTPVSKVTFILGKLIPFWVIGLVLLTLGILIARAIYGLWPSGNIFNIYLFAFFYLLAFTGLGLIISNFAQTQQQAMFVIIFFLIAFILLSGLFTPISSMPKWAQVVTAINPIRYFVEVMRMIYLKGSGFLDILPQLLRILCFVVVINYLAIVSYKKTNG